MRINAAMAFATSRQFGEAERLANEAVAVGQFLRPPRTDLFRGQAEQIQRMKAAAESGAGITGPADGVIMAPNGQRITRGGWFETTTPAPKAPRP